MCGAAGIEVSLFGLLFRQTETAMMGRQGGLCLVEAAEAVAEAVAEAWSRCAAPVKRAFCLFLIFRLCNC